MRRPGSWGRSATNWPLRAVRRSAPRTRRCSPSSRTGCRAEASGEPEVKAFGSPLPPYGRQRELRRRGAVRLHGRQRHSPRGPVTRLAPVATEHIQTPLEGWEEAYRSTPERDAPFTTLSGRPVPPLYTERDLPDAEGDIGLPGQFPFTRGVYPSMYRGRLWTMRQFAGFGTAEETNERFRYLLDHGQTGLSTAFDMPSL